MYKLHLILKYLRKRRIAWVALLAVTLCTAMVLIVISVMGGWLRMFRTSFHGLSGDIVIQSASLSGFSRYEEMIGRIEKLPEVDAAVPVIQTFGLININNLKTDGVNVMGVPIERIGKVNEFPKSLWRQYNQWLEWADGEPIYPSDRQRLRDSLGLDIRPAMPLLTLTREEHNRVRAGVNDANKKFAELRAKVDAENDPAKHDMLFRKWERAAWAVQAIKDLAAAPDGAAARSDERTNIRELLGPIVDDADDRLRPNEAERKITRQQADSHLADVSFKPFLSPEFYKKVVHDANPKAPQAFIDDAPRRDGMILGIGVADIRKDENGKYTHYDALYRHPVSLTVVGVSATGSVDLNSKADRNYWIVDTSRTKVWQYDSKTVYVPFDVLQKDLGMDAQKAEQDGKEITIPPRTKEIHVRIKKPWSDSTQDLIAIRDRIKMLVTNVTDADEPTLFIGSPPVVRTWEESQAKWLGAIEKEMVLMIFLFGMISVVAVFLIFCIFYMIVAEKTRDIGIIKSVGATSSGVAGIFLGYGAVIGIVGAGAGLTIGYLVVHNINFIHTWLGKALNVVVWDPEVYAFDTIPNTMDPVYVTRIIIAAVLASVLGAVIPAIRAARMNPVEALRWE